MFMTKFAVTQSLAMSTTSAHEIPLLIKAMFLLKGHIWSNLNFDESFYMI